MIYDNKIYARVYDSHFWMYAYYRKNDVYYGKEAMFGYQNTDNPWRCVACGGVTSRHHGLKRRKRNDPANYGARLCKIYNPCNCSYKKIRDASRRMRRLHADKP
jgi:hypothetical protein